AGEREPVASDGGAGLPLEAGGDGEVETVGRDAVAGDQAVALLAVHDVVVYGEFGQVRVEQDEERVEVAARAVEAERDQVVGAGLEDIPDSGALGGDFALV